MAKLKTRKLRKKGKKTITFKEGGLHQSLRISPSKKIPAEEMEAALAGKRGKKARAQAQFKKNVLTGPKKRKK